MENTLNFDSPRAGMTKPFSFFMSKPRPLQHKKRRWQTEQQHKLIQKKWDKRFYSGDDRMKAAPPTIRLLPKSFQPTQHWIQPTRSDPHGELRSFDVTCPICKSPKGGHNESA